MLGRLFTAECELCRTKFEADPGECPVCGGTSFRAIREAVAAAEAIPVPTGRTKPPRGIRKRTAAAVPHARRHVSPAPSSATHDPPPRGPDGRFLSRRKAAERAAAAALASWTGSHPGATSGGAAATVRADASDAAKRLEAAMAELREARRASFAALRRKIVAESAVRRIRNEIRRAEEAARGAFRGKGGRKGGLHVVLKTLGGLFTAVVAALP